MPIFHFKSGWEGFSETVSSTFKEGVDSFLKQHTNADLFIITGRGGVGKSSYIKSVTGEDVYIASTLTSATRTTSLVPVVIEGRRCLFLDMPGFNTSDYNDWDIFHRLMTALAVVQRYVNFRGVMYVDPFEETRESPTTKKLLSWLVHFCGEEFMPNVTIVTTKWDELSPTGIKAKMARVEEWKDNPILQPFLKNGARMYHHGLVTVNGAYLTLDINDKHEQRQVVARQDIATHYHTPSTSQLKIYTEIAEGATIDTTSAGRCLRGQTPDSNGRNGGTADTPGAGDHGANDPLSKGQNPGSSGISMEDIKPWVKLLFNAANTYIRASYSMPVPPPTWPFPDDGCGPWGSESASTVFDDEPVFRSREGTGPALRISTWPGMSRPLL
ncbi:hypothetical protein BDV19DRAFT_385326 [Aspergillus venezuelensis]